MHRCSFRVETHGIERVFRRPLPVKHSIHSGKPLHVLHVDGGPDEEDAVIEQAVARVKDATAALLLRGLEQRGGIFR